MTNKYTLDQCRQHLLKLTELKDGWFDGHGKSISLYALKLADEMLLRSTLRPYIYPTYEGGVTFEWDDGASSRAITFKPNSLNDKWISIDYMYDYNNTLMWSYYIDHTSTGLISAIISVMNTFSI